MSKLEEILEKLADADMSYSGDSRYIVKHAKQQVKDLILELIGEDKKQTPDDQETWLVQGYNEAKEELRKKAAEL